MTLTIYEYTRLEKQLQSYWRRIFNRSEKEYASGEELELLLSVLIDQTGLLGIVSTDKIVHYAYPDGMPVCQDVYPKSRQPMYTTIDKREVTCENCKRYMR